MCGIAGMIDSGGSADIVRERLGQMLETIVHRGPDDRGEWVDPVTGVGIGLCRLAIVDLSPTGHQPMISSSGRWVIALNGEIYNFRRLRTELGSEGSFRGESDTEVALAAVERWGVRRAVERFIGMFAIALWDRVDHELTLIRDRLGVKPLYWGRAGSAIVFGSELKALAAHPEFSRRVDRDALSQYFRFGYVPDPRSIWCDARKLPPGTMAVIRPGSAELPVPVVYWSASEVAANGLSSPLEVDDDEAIERVGELLSDAVGLRMIADVPIGVFLSGGIDSSIVAAEMQAQSSQPIRTFSIGFDDPAYDESPWAREVGRRLGTDHTELRATGADALGAIVRLPEIYDEPFADSSQIPTWLVSRLAREHVKVALTGDGGDELFGGYVRHAFAERRWPAIRRVPLAMRRIVWRIAQSLPEPLWASAVDLASRRSGIGGEVARPSEKLRKAMAALGASNESDLWGRLVSLWPDPPTIGGSRGANDETVPGPLLRALPAELLMHADLVHYLPGDLLVKVDRASMGVSLEAREPLLDHRLVELAWRLPLRMRVRDGRGKWILRRLLSRHLPAELIDRPKMGFAVPLGKWLRGPLAPWAEDLLSEERIRSAGYLDPRRVRQAWTEHRSGRRNHEHAVWCALMFQSWIARWGRGGETPREGP